MPDIRELMNSPYLGHWDIIDRTGKHLTVKFTIDFVKIETLEMGEGRKGQKGVVYFRPYKSANGSTRPVKPMVLNSQRTIAIASWHGTDYSLWGGKEITVHIGEAKSPPKWIPLYGVKMPSLFVKPKPRSQQLVEQLSKERTDAPNEEAFEDDTQTPAREPGSDDA